MHFPASFRYFALQPFSEFTMKKYLLLFAFSLGLKAGAQVTLDHTYNGQGTIAHLEYQDEKYALLEASDYRCRIYNADHSLYKTINLPVSSGTPNINTIQYVTDGLFNTDNLIELSYTYYSISGSSIFYETRVCNENGQILVTVTGASAAFVDHIGGSWKYIAWIYDYSSTPPPVDTRVYSLPGNLISNADNTADESRLQLPYPSPANDHINLPYKLPAGSEGRMVISNANGQVIRILSLGSGFDNILFQANGLPAGVYFYNTVGGTGNGKFIIGQ